MNLKGTKKEDKLPADMKRYHVEFKISKKNTFHVFLNAESEDEAIKQARIITMNQFRNKPIVFESISEVDMRAVKTREHSKNYEQRWEC